MRVRPASSGDRVGHATSAAGRSCGLGAGPTSASLQSYLDEMAFRYNNRDNPYLFRDTLLRLIEAGGLPYEELVAGTN